MFNEDNVSAVSTQDKMIDLCEKVLTSRVGVNVEKEDIAHVELKSVSSSESVFTKSIFIRFHDLDLRLDDNQFGIRIYLNFYKNEDLGQQSPCGDGQGVHGGVADRLQDKTDQEMQKAFG